MSSPYLRYPIGKFTSPASVSAEEISAFIHTVEQLPMKLHAQVKSLNDDQLDTTYRDGGWTVRQVIHHLADSHINSYIRFKLALTEDNPVIKPYFEERWAELPEAKQGEIMMSLNLIESVHHRWVIMLKAIKSDEWSRTFFHPEKNISLRLDTTLALYAWHCEHHLAHISHLKTRENW